jgi:hypothetical protein
MGLGLPRGAGKTLRPGLAGGLGVL